jgi:long-chain acyl-CoA synthetase
VSVYNTLTAEQMRYIADNCDAKVAIVEDAAFLGTWESVRAQLPGARADGGRRPDRRRPRP